MKTLPGALITATLLHLPAAAAPLPAFPGAEGFGARAVGGRGGDVYTVTSLEAGGAGSLAEGIATAPAEGRTIVFAVSGYIPVPGRGLRIARPRITLAGQTAPGDGIGLRGGGLRIQGDNTVVRFLRLRRGRGARGGGDCLNVDSSASNSIVDHVSMQFSTDENISFFNSRLDNFTMQWSITAWGLESHNAGGLWDLVHGTCHHSLWAHHHTRNPKARPDGLLEWINNVTFDWDIGFIMGDSAGPAHWKANVVGCYFLMPPGRRDRVALEKGRLDRNGRPNFSLYLADCLHDTDGDGLLNGEDKGYRIVAGSPYVKGEFEPPGRGTGQQRYARPSAPFPGSSPGVSVDDPLTAWKKVVSQAGAVRLDAGRPGSVHDEVDALLVHDVVMQRHSRIASEAELAAPPHGVSNDGFGTLQAAPAPADGDGDGMPDYWEHAVGSDPGRANHRDPVPAGAYVPDEPAGYTLLEEYLHFLAVPHAVMAKRTASGPSVLSVDLRRFTGGFRTAPVRFRIANQTGGAAALQPDGATVRFEPALGFTGRAGFDFTVTDGDGSTWTRTLAVLVGTDP